MTTLIDYTPSPALELPSDPELMNGIARFSKRFRAAIIRSEVRDNELHIWMDPKICECDLHADFPIPVYIWVMRLLLEDWSSSAQRVTQIVGHVREIRPNDTFGLYVVDPLDYVGRTDGDYHMARCHDVIAIKGLLTWVAD